MNRMHFHRRSMGHSRPWMLAVLLAFVMTSIGRAQSVCLPLPRLLTTMPMGGQVGSEFDVTISGQAIDDGAAGYVPQLVFSHPGLAATPKMDADGKWVANQYHVTVESDCPVGVYEARVMTRLGLSSSRIFSVGDLVEVIQTTPATTLEQAMPLEINSVCNATMPVKGVNHYRFEAKSGQRILVDCAARGIDSKLYPVVIVADGQGRDLVVQRRGDVIDFRVPSDGAYVVKVHELTFQGGAEFFYRLALRELAEDATPMRMASTSPVNSFSWPPVGINAVATLEEVETPLAADAKRGAASVQTITLPCDVAGAFYPAADVDVFEFTAKKGEVWWVEVASERLGLPTDPSILVQRVTDADESLVDVVELTDIASPVKVSSNGYAYDGPPYSAGSSDILGKVEIPEDGRYRLQLVDLFGGTRVDPRNKYRMMIRQAAPDFAIVAWAMHMELRNGDRNALSKPMSLRPGTTMALEVVAIRRDWFDGEIEIVMSDLPDGVTAQGLKIPAGQSRGVMLVTADATAPHGYSHATFVGRAKVGENVVERLCRLASMAWPVQDAWSEIPSPRLLGDIPVSVGNVEVAPITIEPRSGEVIEVVENTSLVIPLVHIRRSEFSGATMGMKTMGLGFEANPQFDLPLTADASEAMIDLAKLKVAPGDYWIAFYGSAVAKYSPEAVALVGVNAQAASPPAPEKKTPTQDIVDIVVSQPIHIRVLAAESK